MTLFKPLASPMLCNQALPNMCKAAHHCTRWRTFTTAQHTLPQPTHFANMVYIVPQQVACVVERFGKFQRLLNPGLHFLFPWIDRLAYTHSLKEQAISISNQNAITKDNVTIQLDGVLYLRVDDPYNASYGVKDPFFAVTQLAQTTMRSELGKLTLDETFLEREALNLGITKAINAAADSWGMRCMRYEIRDIIVPSTIRNAMERQAEAERRKRADILQSEAEKQTEINLSQGKKQALILQAQGEAEAMIQRSQATANGLRRIAEALQDSHCRSAVSLQLAEQYIEAFGRLAKESTTLILPSSVNDLPNLVAQGVALFQKINTTVGSHMDKEGTPLPSQIQHPKWVNTPSTSPSDTTPHVTQHPLA